ncbi:YqgE/AlgH family protein [Candidatus Neomarinimicrobiota bacterium]
MDSLTDHLLISMPHLNDIFFDKTVIYLCAHDSSGAMGMVINRPLMSAQVAEILEALDLGDDGANANIREIYYGGPVQPSLGFVLHSPEYALESTEQISKAVALSTSLEVIRDIQYGTGPAFYRFTLGYAGWGPEQLEREIANGDWLLIPAESDIIFKKPDHIKWEESARQFGIEIAQMGGGAGQS